MIISIVAGVAGERGPRASSVGGILYFERRPSVLTRPGDGLGCSSSPRRTASWSSDRDTSADCRMDRECARSGGCSRILHGRQADPALI